MQNTGLDEAQDGIKTAWRNISKLKHTDNTTIMAERAEKLKSFLVQMKEESEKAN